jgi:hypothetical protein
MRICMQMRGRRIAHMHATSTVAVATIAAGAHDTLLQARAAAAAAALLWT